MNSIQLIIERLRLRAEIGLHRHGPWWLLLALSFFLLLGTALFVIPARHAELAAQQSSLQQLQARAAGDEQPAAPSLSPSESHYQAFRQVLAKESELLPAIKAVLDSVARHRLHSNRAEYRRGRDVHAQAETLQMTVPVRGHYADIRRWIEELLATQPFLAVEELAFKRDEIGANEIEARVRLTLWHQPASPVSSAERVGVDQ